MASVEGQTEDFSLIDAINAKYSDDNNGTDVKVYISSNAPGRKESGVVVPPILVLDNNKVTCAGPRDTIASLCCHVTELDLTNNLFTCWKEVLSMITNIPQLQTLNLTSNSLTASSLMGPHVDGQTFPNVTLLILNNTKTTWSSLTTLLRIFPSLTELHLSLNGYTSVDLCDLEPYPSLTKLFINKHFISQWSEVSKLGCVFPHLETLVTIESDLSDMISDCSEVSWSFPCLKCLHISSTKLLNWNHTEELRKMPKLCDIRMKNIPFLEEYNEKVRRQMLIARLPNITHLNGSPINDTEREDAERAFLRFYMDKEDQPVRYHELERTYGKLDPLVDLDFSPRMTRRVTIQMDEDGKTEEMNISITQTVREFKKLLQTFSGLRFNQFRLFLFEEVDGVRIGPRELKMPDKILHTFNINDDDIFVIIPKYFQQ